MYVVWIFQGKLKSNNIKKVKGNRIQFLPAAAREEAKNG
jgi:hypothetical protein